MKDIIHNYNKYLNEKCGRHGYVECYKFYKNTSKGATLDIEPCNNIYIVESNKEIPRIDVINVIHKTNPLICFDFGTYSYYRIYVPKNTIVNDYNIDMK